MQYGAAGNAPPGPLAAHDLAALANTHPLSPSLGMAPTVVHHVGPTVVQPVSPGLLAPGFPSGAFTLS